MDKMTLLRFTNQILLTKCKSQKHIGIVITEAWWRHMSMICKMKLKTNKINNKKLSIYMKLYASENICTHRKLIVRFHWLTLVILATWEAEIEMIKSLRPVQASSSGDIISKIITAKWTGSVAPAWECQLYKHEALSLNPSLHPKIERFLKIIIREIMIETHKINLNIIVANINFKQKCWENTTFVHFW
jgi:hypothetical protein